MDKAIAAGFTPVITPTLVKPEIMAGTGFLGAHADEIYHLGSRRPVPRRHQRGGARRATTPDEILDLSDGPMRYAGWSACYRREAGSYGKDTRGIIRVHQFHKVEMFVWCRVEDAADEHRRLLGWEEEMLGAVELPYRVIDVAAGDLGSSAARKFDCEAWLPTQQRWLELTSTSNCTTYQARRLDVRERNPHGPRAVTGRSRRSTERWPRRAGSSPCWRTTSCPTGPSASRRRCGRTSGAWTLLEAAVTAGRAAADRPRRRRDDHRLRRGPQRACARGGPRRDRRRAPRRRRHRPFVARDPARARPARPGPGLVRVQQRRRHAPPGPGLPSGYEIADLVTFDPAPALRLLREHLPTALYAVENVGVGFRLTAPFPPGELYGELEYVDFEELLATPATRVIVRSPEHTAAGVPPDRREGRAARRQLRGRLDGVARPRARRRLEGQRAGTGPGRAAGRRERTLAIGDGRNDIEMLRWAGRAVAMGQAEPELLRRGRRGGRTGRGRRSRRRPGAAHGAGRRIRRRPLIPMSPTSASARLASCGPLEVVRSSGCPGAPCGAD